MLLNEVNNFLSNLEIVKQLSFHTIHNYKRDVEKFCSYLSEEDISSWQNVREHEVRSYINKERRRGLNPRSLQRILSSIRSFFNYLVDENIIQRQQIYYQKPWTQTWFKNYWTSKPKEQLK